LKFKGAGIVKNKGKIIANFELTEDKTFETANPAVIQRLSMLGYREAGIKTQVKKRGRGKKT